MLKVSKFNACVLAFACLNEKSKPGELGHFDDEPFLLSLTVSRQLILSPVITVGIGQPGISPIPGSHGVVKPVETT